ncbi:hemicentin-2-like isoform X2 [Gigantopelta aegis]|uniref:hemicentin-2-like isoform X2 n=1 Tax=Gigantopelta aegis TaxID=1735272 RepID=UPI001B88B183|nr:hemicentin-2-like isoform X2 [Gigantopelta aegis]
MASFLKWVSELYGKKLILMALLINIDICLGLANTTIDCMGYGIPGRSTVLTCEIAGTVVAGVRWIRPNGGTPLMVMTCNKANTLCLPTGGVTGYGLSRDSPTHQTLTIESFNSSVDAGEWICRDGITGVGGPDSVTLSIPSPGLAAEGANLTVTCAASCKPPCSYSWTLGNQQISATSLLKLTNINRSQTGNVYTCTANNSLIPKSKTKQFTPTVYYGPDRVQLNSTSPLTVKEGDDVDVSCGATNCSPSCSFMWQFKSPIEPSSSVLSLNNIQRSSAGDYTCTARNTNTQKSLDKTITLDVQYQSSITSLTLNTNSTKVTVDELTPMILRCEVDSNPGSHIKLTMNSQTLREVTNSKQIEYTWNEAGCLNTGHYTCEAGNNIKSVVRESVQLVVRCSPRLQHGVLVHKQYVAPVGGDVTMKISVIANPTPTFTWYHLTGGNKNRLGSRSPDATGIYVVGKLTLTNVQQRDIGTYHVVVSNGAPRQDLMVNLALSVAGAQELALSGSSSYAVLNQPFTLTCTVTQAADLGDTVQFYYNIYTDVFASLYQSGGSCTEFSGPSLRSDYSVSCGSGTDSSSSTTKKYTLKINRVADRDAIDWWCILSSGRIRSNKYNLQLSTNPVPNPESQVSESTISIIAVVAVLLVVAIAVSWFWYKRRVNREPKSEQEKTEKTTQEGCDERVLVDNPAFEQSN